MSTTQTSQQISIEEALSKIFELIESLKKKQIPYPPRLTKYEIARIVAARAKQLASGAQPMVDVEKLNTIDPVLIAIEELKQGRLPFIIVRTLPTGKKIEVKLKDLLELQEKYSIYINVV